MPADQPKPIRIRRIVLMLWRIFLIVTIFLWLHPVSYRTTRAAIILLVLFMWGSSLWLWGKRKWFKILWFSLVALGGVIAILPMRKPNVSQLRSDYVASLKKYEGTLYVWGGENKFGIDCSGLVRRGMIDATLKEGVFRIDPGLVRESFLMRWYDCTAQSLMEEYRNKTVKLFPAESIASLDHSKLLPGDFAVTSSGLHTLAYIGDSQWVEADPGPHRVVIVKSSDDVGWLKMPVQLMRWKVFVTDNK